MLKLDFLLAFLPPIYKKNDFSTLLGLWNLQIQSQFWYRLPLIESIGPLKKKWICGILKILFINDTRQYFFNTPSSDVIVTIERTKEIVFLQFRKNSMTVRL